MKKLILAAILCASVSLSTSVYAQKGERQGRSGYEKLDLTDKQKEELKSERNDFASRLKELNADKSLNKDSRKAKANELRTAHKEKVGKILTPEQRERMEKIRAEKPKKEDRKHFSKGEKRGGRDHAQRGSGHVRLQRCEDCGNMAKHLNLTDAQKEQIKSINKSYADKEKELKEQRKADVMKVYTPEQQAKLKQVQLEKLAQRNKITLEGAAKLQALKDGFKKESQAISMSRIAPDAQKSKLKDLSEKHRSEIKELKKQYAL